MRINECEFRSADPGIRFQSAFSENTAIVTTSHHGASSAGFSIYSLFGNVLVFNFQYICDCLQAIRVFFLLRDLSLTLRQEPETQLPLTKQDECVKVNDVLDLSK